MKYLKPLSAILLGRCGVNIWKTHTEDYMTTLAGTIISGENGTDEQFCGIYVTQSQLKQIRYEIDGYLKKTTGSTLVPKDLAISDNISVKLNPNRVTSRIIHCPPKGKSCWEARTTLYFDKNEKGEEVDMVALADSEEMARTELDKKFTSFIQSMISPN